MTDNKKMLAALTDQIEELANRLEELEASIHSHGAAGAGQAEDDLCYCSMPEVPERDFGPNVTADRRAAIGLTGKKWVNGTKLHYHFLQGANKQKEVVRQAFKTWKDVGIGLEFEEVTSIEQAELRIGFRLGIGSWSYVGRDNLMIGQSNATMNFGWDLTQSGRNGMDTALHEIGHALGFEHEHQNPRAGIVWNELAVLRYFAQPPNRWAPNKTRQNVLEKLNTAEVEGSDWDPDSIMHYAFARGLIAEPAQYRSGISPAPGLSDRDREVVKQFYPDGSPSGGVKTLQPGQTQVISIEPGAQTDFDIVPDATRRYTISTLGESDTVMVLFEDIDGDFVYMSADDDSGEDRNATITTRLIEGRKYKLRIRLFYAFSRGRNISVILT